MTVCRLVVKSQSVALLVPCVQFGGTREWLYGLEFLGPWRGGGGFNPGGLRGVERRGWTAGKARGGVGHLGLAHTGTQRGRLWTTGGRRRGAGSKNRQMTHNLYADYWAPLTHKQHPPQPAQPRHTNHWAPRTQK